jgi:hypothetical protein
MTLILIKRPDKMTIGGEWKPIKILYENLFYVPNLT